MKALEPRRKRRFVKYTAIGIVVLLGLYIGLSVFGAIAAMDIPRLPVQSSPDTVGLVYEDVSFSSRDGVELKGWFLPAAGHFVIIIVHGGFENRVDNVVGTLNLAHDLVQKGLNILLFDLRGRGESAGKGRSLSNIDRDIGGAVDYIKSRGYSASNIGIMGFCSGAASACIFASEEHIGALVLNGCFTSVHNMVVQQAVERKIPKYLTNFFFSGVQTAARTMYKYRVINPIDVVGNVPCPIFFMHEELDELVTAQDDIMLFEATDNPANSFWEIKGALHSKGYMVNPPEYVQKVADFFNTYLK